MVDLIKYASLLLTDVQGLVQRGGTPMFCCIAPGRVLDLDKAGRRL